tara:strand:+ start:20477 stop:22111 length:1635 start_codon:yes stop_codon:yes gene_type:complete
MKVFSMLLTLLLSLSVWGQINIDFKPERPVQDESFDMLVTIAFEGNEEPFISFDPGGLNVEGRRKGGVSFTTQLINGQFTSQKTMTFIYQLRANRTGSFYLRDFNVRVGQKTIKKDNIRVQVLREAERPKDYFLEAVPSKETAYKGEGFFVNYYLYTRVPIYNKELKEYPKLNGFLKRFKNVDQTPERVERGGLIYQRGKEYSARLFPEKTGELTIDPLKIQVSVGFGGAGGFGLRDMRNVTLSSAPIKIKVSEAPLDNIPEGFTGLIGEHKFSLIMNKTKFLANEPVEAKLEIVGPGLLEKMDDPVLYSHPDLESFDTRSEIQEISPDQSRKVLEYTYLPRGQMKLASRQLRLSVFDPESMSYKTTEITIPELEVVGGGGARPSQANIKAQPQNFTDGPTAVAKFETALTPLSPFGSVLTNNPLGNVSRIILLVSSLILFLALFSNLQLSTVSRKERLWLIYKKQLSTGVDFKGLYQFVNEIESVSESDLDSVIANKNLPDDVKAYFTELINSLRSTTYSRNSNDAKLKPQKRMFKKLIKSLS